MVERRQAIKHMCHHSRTRFDASNRFVKCRIAMANRGGDIIVSQMGNCFQCTRQFWRNREHLDVAGADL